jgi:hypothetical protein
MYSHDFDVCALNANALGMAELNLIPVQNQDSFYTGWVVPATLQT